ncbi:uracil-DNA glycosylase [Bryobacter aggregatus]|uniref:uracil-DNA glycosylase n=1 Tax=Bryobacter aggregatus TaxID=360054 RepID=UPI0004E0FF06|nr:uracil-DNA glycosylase [Bryobacter aggregatus]
MSRELQKIAERVVACTACPRLIEYCQEVARVKRRAYRDEEYWGKPVPGFGDPNARLLIVGLAPAAHGANRTGRMFTGDRSGDFLFRAMYETGFASQPEGKHRNDGLELIDAYLAASGRCAPPDNKPLPEELARCRHFLIEEMAALKNIRAVLCLGQIALDSYTRAIASKRLAFGHGLVHDLTPTVLCSYHPSQQNTQTGRLTMPMFQDIFVKASQVIHTPATKPPSA